jgi:hypothetical protein
VRLRYAPTIEFLDDDVARSSARIDELLAGLDLGDHDGDHDPEPPPDAHGERPAHAPRS